MSSPRPRTSGLPAARRTSGGCQPWLRALRRAWSSGSFSTCSVPRSTGRSRPRRSISTSRPCSRAVSRSERARGARTVSAGTRARRSAAARTREAAPSTRAGGGRLAPRQLRGLPGEGADPGREGAPFGPLRIGSGGERLGAGAQVPGEAGEAREAFRRRRLARQGAGEVMARPGQGLHGLRRYAQDGGPGPRPARRPASARPTTGRRGGPAAEGAGAGGARSRGRWRGRSRSGSAGFGGASPGRPRTRPRAARASAGMSGPAPSLRPAT